MKFFVMAVALLVVIAAIVKGQDDSSESSGFTEEPFPDGSDERRGSNGQDGYTMKHPITILDFFPACKNLGQAIREKHEEMIKSGQIGHRSCHENDPHLCWHRGLKTVRCAVEETPSKDCMDQVAAFIQGNVCNAEKADESTTRDSNSTLDQR